MHRARPRLLATNQVTSTLFRDVLDAVVEAGIEVKLVAGYLELGEGYRPGFEWIPATELRKSPAWRRIWTWGLFTLQAWRAMAGHPDCLCLLTTNPPLVPWIAPFARRLFGLHYVLLVYDIYPDAMERMGMIRAGGIAARMLRRLSAESLRHAECVITLGEDMKRTVLAHLPSGRRVPVEVIPNWADIDVIRPIPKEENPFARRHGLVEKFVVMYSGAFGATHNIGNIVEAAESLQDLADVQFVLIGGGTCEEEVRDLVARKALPNLALLPWQETDQVRYSLAAADCQIVSLDVGYEGISVPSKTYTALAAGAAILAISSPGTELTETIARHDCGVVLPPRNSQALAEAVRQVHADRSRLEEMKRNARRAAEEEYNAHVCTRRYLAVLAEAMGVRPAQPGKT